MTDKLIDKIRKLQKNIEKEKEKHKMFEIREVANVEATGSLIGSAISCAGTWGSSIPALRSLGLLKKIRKK